MTQKSSDSARSTTRKTLMRWTRLSCGYFTRSFGFGKKRLRAFYDSFSTELDALVKRYEMGDEDKAWLCSRKLKDYGIDISTWNKEETK